VTRRDKHVREQRDAFLEGISVPPKSEFVADAFQLEAIEALEAGRDTLVVAPTGAGKTYIAVEGIRKALRKGLRAIYTAPLKALSNAKYSEFRREFEPEFSVGLLTGDRKIDADANVVVATTEIYRNDLYSGRGDYGLVVLDEIHYLADPQRGPVWEESIILSPSTSVLLMLSASISNPKEVAEWIEEVRHQPVAIVTVQERPVELRLGFLHTEFGVVPLADAEGKCNPDVIRCYSDPRWSAQGRGFPKGKGHWNRGNRRRRK